MGFFSTTSRKGEVSVDTLHRMGCTLCPLRDLKNVNPDMLPTGADKPVVYILGEAPGEEEDRQGKQFVGPSGKLLRRQIPERMLSKIRWNNVVRCFPGDTIVTSPFDVEVIYRRWFKGDLVVISTCLGYNLSVTPNHPILTRRGWVAAKALKFGDYIVSDQNWGKRFGFGGPNEQHKPIRIDELFSSLALVGISKGMVGRTMDFHGDGTNGNVDVVLSGRELVDVFNPTSAKFFDNSEFTRSCGTFASLSFDCLQEGKPFLQFSRETMSNSRSETFASFNSGVCPSPHDVAFGGRAYFDSVSFEVSSNSVGRGVFLPCDFFTTDPTQVLENNVDLRLPVSTSVRDFLSFSMCTKLDIFEEKHFAEGVAVNTELFSSLTEAGSFGVELDCVSYLSSRHFEGHVYSLRTRSGWHLAQNLVVSNTRPKDNTDPPLTAIESCRSSIVVDIEKSKPRAIFGFGNFALKWALDQEGINNWRGRRAPVQIGNHVCWFFPMLHPSFVLHKRGEQEARTGRTLREDQIGPEEERFFRFDLEDAFHAVERLPVPKVWTPEEAKANLVLLDGSGKNDLAKLEKMLADAVTEEVNGVDWETNMKRPYDPASLILTAAISTLKFDLAFALDHAEQQWGSKLPKVRGLLREYLMSGVIKATHNAAFEQEWAALKFGSEVVWKNWACTMSQAAVLDQRTGRGETKGKSGGPHSLDFVTLQHFGIHLKAMSNLNLKNMAAEPLREILPYNGMDAKFHRMVFLTQRERLEDEELDEVFRRDNEAIPSFVLTQIEGLPVYQPETSRLQIKYGDLIEDLQHDIADDPVVRLYEKRYKKKFNPASNAEVTVLVRDVLESRAGMRDTGKYSVDDDTLELVTHPIGKKLQSLRKYSKLKSTYIDGCAPGGDYLHADGKLHPVISTTIARTGRTSSEEPNEQNWPIRDKETREVRRQIRAPKGHVIAKFDQGQIQGRNIAMESRDKVFVQALWERYDIHMDWAERLSRAYPERVGGKQYFKDKKVMNTFRSDVKNQWTFPAFFGAGAPSLAGYLHIPEEIAKEQLDDFWRMFSGVKDWQDRMLATYRETGYTESLDGRRRYGPLTKNQVLNSPIQADEICLMKDAATRLARAGYVNCLFVHDDLTYIFPVEDLERRCEFVVTEMLTYKKFKWINVPLTVELSIGQDWDRMEKVASYSSDKWLQQ
jgi:uracil-DNA glycosylase family 4